MRISDWSSDVCSSDLYASGDEPAYRRAAEVLDAFTREHHWMGEFGNASRIKYVLNFLVCIHNAAMGEALSFATKIGLDPKQVYELVDDSAASSWVWQIGRASCRESVCPYV